MKEVEALCHFSQLLNGSHMVLSHIPAYRGVLLLADLKQMFTKGHFSEMPRTFTRVMKSFFAEYTHGILAKYQRGVLISKSNTGKPLLIPAPYS